MPKADAVRAKRGVRDLLDRNVLRQNLAPGRYSDGAGLYLTVRETGRSWVFMFTRNGKRREMGLGPAGDPKPDRPSDLVSLKAARALADEARALLARGLDPLEERRRIIEAAQAEADRIEGQEAGKSVITFGKMADAFIDGGEVAGQTIAGQSGGFRNDKHVAQWRMTLGDAYCRALRNKPIAEISTADVLGVLQPIWQTKNETASRLRGRIERVLDAAKALGFREGENPARWRGHLDHLLTKRQKLQRGHHAAMAYVDVPGFIAKLREREAASARALEFLILTAARSGEVRGAEWPEIDLEGKVWTVPAERMKAGRLHRVPLTPRAIAILNEVKPLTGGQGLVFSTGRGQMSDMTLSALLKRMDYTDVTVHGFRSSFRDWAFEVSRHPRDLAEAALAHVFGDATERAYRRGDALDKRREMMLDWEHYVAGEVAKVVSISRGRKRRA